MSSPSDVVLSSQTSSVIDFFILYLANITCDIKASPGVKLDRRGGYLLAALEKRIHMERKECVQSIRKQFLLTKKASNKKATGYPDLQRIQVTFEDLTWTCRDELCVPEV